MAIDRIAAQKIVEIIPKKLRDAARTERQIIAKAAKQNPVATSIEAAYGKYNFSNNIELQTKLRELNKKFAEDAYRQTIYHRQPMGFMPEDSNMPKVVKASMNLD